MNYNNNNINDMNNSNYNENGEYQNDNGINYENNDDYIKANEQQNNYNQAKKIRDMKSFPNNNIYNNNNNSNNDNNRINLNNIYNQNILQNQMNLNNQIGKNNIPYINLNQNQLNQLIQLSKLNQNIANYLNQLQNNNNNISNNNNINNINNMNNMNDILLQNLSNNNINYNKTNNKNINFSSIANAYMNQSLMNQNIYNSNNQTNNNNNINKMQIPLQNINTNNNTNTNNSLYNNALKYYLYHQQGNNNGNPNINSQIQNNMAYMNGINSINNMSNFNNNLIQNQVNNNNNLSFNNLLIPESVFYSLSPIQLAQNCHIIAKNQSGCRYLQNCITSNPDLLKNLFFPKILEHFIELSNDQFANYLVKKIFQYLTEDMLLQLIQVLGPIIDQVGTNQYGTRVLQDLIDCLNTEKTFFEFIKIIIPHVKLLIIDLNGSHIIYKLILTKNKSVKFIENIICMNVKDIAITRKGCSFLKKYFEFANENDLIQIKQGILENLFKIITDQYGNYIIQSILTKEGSPIVKDFINEINKNIIVYSNNKFASNAVEKCFENESMKNEVLDKFLQKDIFEKIILDKFGNYVVQKAIAKADNERKKYMLQLLIPLVPSLKSQYFGQRLLSKLVLQYPDLNIN
jgi:hypothetical protein